MHMHNPPPSRHDFIYILHKTDTENLCSTYIYRLFHFQSISRQSASSPLRAALEDGNEEDADEDDDAEDDEIDDDEEEDDEEEEEVLYSF